MSSRLRNPFHSTDFGLRTFEAYRVPSEELLGWCIQYRVWAYGYAGQPIPEHVLRESLDAAVQHVGIYGRLWSQTGGFGGRYGAPGNTNWPTDSERYDRAIEAHEAHESRQRFYANNPDEDYTQDWETY